MIVFSSEVRLTEKQRTVLAHVAAGMTTAESGAKLFLSRHTVRLYRCQVYEQLGAINAAHAVHIGHQLGLLR